MYYVGHNPARDIMDSVHWNGFDPRLHVVVGGKTRTGKSTLQENFATYIAASEDAGMFVVDPHGPLATALHRRFAPDRVFYFSVSNLAPLNFLAIGDPRLAIDAAWRFIAKGDNQPESERIFRFSLWCLYKACPIDAWEEGSTQTHPVPDFGLLNRFLNDEEFRKSVWMKLPPGDEVREWFENVFDGDWAENHARIRIEKSAPINNKIAKFVLDPLLRQIFCTSKCVNLREMMDEGKFVILNLARAYWGDETSEFLGAVWGFLHQQAAISRQDLLDRGVKPKANFAIWDEFGAFPTLNIKTYMQEAGKYQVFFMVASQTFTTIPHDTLEYLLGNANALVIYRLGASNAELFAAEFGDKFRQKEIQNLDNYVCFLQRVKDGMALDSVKLRAFPPNFQLTSD